MARRVTLMPFTKNEFPRRRHSTSQDNDDDESETLAQTARMPPSRPLVEPIGVHDLHATVGTSEAAALVRKKSFMGDSFVDLEQTFSTMIEDNLHGEDGEFTDGYEGMEKEELIALLREQSDQIRVAAAMGQELIEEIRTMRETADTDKQLFELETESLNATITQQQDLIRRQRTEIAYYESALKDQDALKNEIARLVKEKSDSERRMAESWWKMRAAGNVLHHLNMAASDPMVLQRYYSSWRRLIARKHHLQRLTEYVVWKTMQESRRHAYKTWFYTALEHKLAHTQSVVSVADHRKRVQIRNIVSQLSHKVMLSWAYVLWTRYVSDRKYIVVECAARRTRYRHVLSMYISNALQKVSYCLQCGDFWRKWNVWVSSQRKARLLSHMDRTKVQVWSQSTNLGRNHVLYRYYIRWISQSGALGCNGGKRRSRKRRTATSGSTTLEVEGALQGLFGSSSRHHRYSVWKRWVSFTYTTKLLRSQGTRLRYLYQLDQHIAIKEKSTYVSHMFKWYLKWLFYTQQKSMQTMKRRRNVTRQGLAKTLMSKTLMEVRFHAFSQWFRWTRYQRWSSHVQKLKSAQKRKAIQLGNFGAKLSTVTAHSHDTNIRMKTFQRWRSIVFARNVEDMAVIAQQTFESDHKKKDRLRRAKTARTLLLGATTRGTMLRAWRKWSLRHYAMTAQDLNAQIEFLRDRRRWQLWNHIAQSNHQTFLLILNKYYHHWKRCLALRRCEYLENIAQQNMVIATTHADKLSKQLRLRRQQAEHLSITLSIKSNHRHRARVFHRWYRAFVEPVLLRTRQNQFDAQILSLRYETRVHSIRGLFEHGSRYLRDMYEEASRRPRCGECKMSLWSYHVGIESVYCEIVKDVMNVAETAI